MKTTLEQLPRQLQQALQPIYLISGDEILLVNEAVAHIRQASEKAGFHEQQRYTVDNQFNWQQFAVSANTASLFSDKCLLELHFHDTKLNENAKTTLLDYCEQLPPDKILILKFPKLDGPAQATTWFKTIEKLGVFLPIWPIERAQLPAWINKRLQLAGLKADATAVELLAEASEGNLLAVQQTIEKLGLLYDKATNISITEMSATLTDNARFTLFDYVDSCLLGDSKRAQRILANLQAEGAETNLILWALVRELRNLIAMAEEHAQGQRLDNILLQHRVWEKRKAMIKATLQRLSLQKLHTCLQKAAALDRIIKGAGAGNVWNELLSLGLTIAGTEVKI